MRKSITHRSMPVMENAGGRFEIIPGENVHSLSWDTFNFRWTLGFDVEPGGGVEIVLFSRFPTNRWSLPQTSDPAAAGYVTARADSDTLVSIDILQWPQLQKAHGAVFHIIQVSVGGRTMKKGEVIEITYGDKRGGSLGAQVQAVAREVAFPVFVSSGHSPRFLERFMAWGRDTTVATFREKADFSPTLRVTGGNANSFNITAPMEIEPGTPFDLSVAVLDKMCNAASNYGGVIEFSSTDEKAESLSSISVEGALGKLTGVTLNSTGFHRIYAIDPNRGILGVSNPIRVTKNARRIYWGDIHGHSELSDAYGSLDEHYTYARDTALLDFASVSDHDHSLESNPDRWRILVEKAKEYSKPNTFIALLSYEGRLRSENPFSAYGDVNAYYLAEDDEMLKPFPAPLNLSITEGKEVLLIAHHPLYGFPGMGTHWKYLDDIPDNIMPLVEIFSTHGNSEYYNCPRHVVVQKKGQSVLDALKSGFRFGFMGSSDYHEVLTGHLLRIQDTPRTINNRHMQARGGLMAVRADSLTRSGIYDAMKAKKTYATSGIRAYVDFAINDKTMGTETQIASPSDERTLKIAVAAPERITKLEVIRNGEVMIDFADGNWFVETEITDKDPIPEGAFYYLRATTERNDFAWSSPIWVDVVK